MLSPRTWQLRNSDILREPPVLCADERTQLETHAQTSTQSGFKLALRLRDSGTKGYGLYRRLTDYKTRLCLGEKCIVGCSEYVLDISVLLTASKASRSHPYVFFSVLTRYVTVARISNAGQSVLDQCHTAKSEDRARAPIQILSRVTRNHERPRPPDSPSSLGAFILGHDYVLWKSAVSQVGERCVT